MLPLMRWSSLFLIITSIPTIGCSKPLTLRAKNSLIWAYLERSSDSVEFLIHSRRICTSSEYFCAFPRTYRTNGIIYGCLHSMSSWMSACFWYDGLFTLRRPFFFWIIFSILMFKSLCACYSVLILFIFLLAGCSR